MNTIRMALQHYLCSPRVLEGDLWGGRWVADGQEVGNRWVTDR